MRVDIEEILVIERRKTFREYWDIFLGLSTEKEIELSTLYSTFSVIRMIYTIGRDLF